MKAKVLTGGLEAKPVCPLEEFTGNWYEGFPETNGDWIIWQEENPQLPLTTPCPEGLIIECNKVWQYRFDNSDDRWTTDLNIRKDGQSYTDWHYEFKDISKNFITREALQPDLPITEKAFTICTKCNCNGEHCIHCGDTGIEPVAPISEKPNKPTFESVAKKLYEDWGETNPVEKHHVKTPENRGIKREGKFNSNMQLRLNIWVNGQRGNTYPVDICNAGYDMCLEDVVKVIEDSKVTNPHYPQSYHTEGYNQALTDLLTKLKTQ